MPDAQTSLRASDFPLTGEWATLADFLAHVDAIDMWPEPPEYELQRNWRRWTFESAALDLALRQSGTSLPEVLGRTPQPVTFVNSFGLGDPPDIDKVAGRRAMNPTVGFKLDVAPSWTQEIMDRIAAVEGIATIDFKGQYGLEVEDEAALLAMYERTLATFTEASSRTRTTARRCSRCSRRSPIASPTTRRSRASSRSARHRSRWAS